MANQVKTEKVWYVGGFTLEAKLVSAKGKSFAIPPIGEWLEVPVHIANDLIRRNRNPLAGGLSVFTKNRQFAEAVKAGNFTPFSPVAQAPVEEKEWTRDELIEKLAELDAVVEVPNNRKASKKVEETE